MVLSGPWSPRRRFGFRFLFALVVLSAPRLINYAEFYIVVEPLKRPLGAILDGIFYTQLHVLSAIGRFLIRWGHATPSANGLLEFLAGLLVTALGIALLWTAIDRRRTQYVVLEHWMRVYVRYQLAAAMFIYGLLKVWPAQFGWFRPSNLIRPLGDASPQRLLWTFMAYSPGYTVFTGLVESLGALLLLFRQSSVLGSLLVAGALANVFALDLAYGVDPEALLSASLLLLFAVVLLAPHAGAVARFLLFRPATPLVLDPAPQGIARRAAPVVKGVIIAILLIVPWREAVTRRRSFFGIGPRSTASTRSKSSGIWHRRSRPHDRTVCVGVG